MRIELKKIPIRDVVNCYVDDAENGARGYGGKLNIRPSFQREFIYNGKQRDEVIKTITKNFPLNVMYWVKNSDDTYELLDGQQRTISICQYIKGEFSIVSDKNPKPHYFSGLTLLEQKEILDYELMVYLCEGDDKEKLDWFKIINISGLKLTDQELLNAIYTGVWLVEAKKRFSKTGCVAYDLAHTYLIGTAIRQDYLETAIRWISQSQPYKKEDGKSYKIEDYMAKHQHDPNASELWDYFEKVIKWVEDMFPVENYRKEMKGLEWGILYDKYKDNKYDPTVVLERRIVDLIKDDDVQNKKGIYEFLLSGEKERSVLNLRAFDEKTIAKVYERQKGICPMCDPKKHYTRDKMEADHIIPWSREGGKTTEENCQMLCMHHNRTKSGK
jgi:hypothetical protein